MLRKDILNLKRKGKGMEKIYVIEEKNTWHSPTCYRFHSNYNGAVGAWNTTKKGAENDGESHQRIVIQVHKVKEGKGYV